MKYLKEESFKETKLRLKQSLYNKLKEIAKIKNVSMNKLINDLLEDVINKFQREKYEVLHREIPEVIYDDGDIKLLHNDFLRLDTRELEGKVNLVVTSPPYNVGIAYNSVNDYISYKEYLEFTREYLKKIYNLLAEDGRLCLNIPLDKNRGGIQSVYADVVTIAKDVGLKYQTTIIWNEQNISRRTAWGSWMSASAPYVIAPVEVIVVFYKETWKRKEKGVSDITREEFIKWTNGLWTFPGENRKKVNHPAPFPLELPYRCIKLFSFKDDLVLDPFVGSGTTMVACKLLKRKGIGVDIDRDYLETAVKRLKETTPSIFEVS